jgi:riboflavin synthase alpha subunit
MNYIQLKSELKRINNKNHTIVKCRKEHTCMHCGKHIAKNTECLTINSKNSERKWVCKSCIGLLLEIQNAKAVLNNTAFDDEGAALANIENLDLAIAEFESTKRKDG